MADAIYGNEPPVLEAKELESFKQSRRSAYFHKRNRWEKVKGVVDEAREGGFDGLIVGSLMEPAGILKHLVPLLAGSASVAIYSPTIEPLTQLMDMYSTARRTAFIHRSREVETQGGSDAELNEEFEVDPTLLLPPNLHTLRVRQWQVLPGRTHPLMSSRGGAEGYLFHGIRVLPATEKIQAAGAFRKRRKVTSTATTNSGSDVEMASTSV
jgi:tRNA (adenine-N(1)-)-methyltransferase non-catalytic subunit